MWINTHVYALEINFNQEGYSRNAWNMGPGIQTVGTQVPLQYALTPSPLPTTPSSRTDVILTEAATCTIAALHSLHALHYAFRTRRMLQKTSKNDALCRDASETWVGRLEVPSPTSLTIMSPVLHEKLKVTQFVKKFFKCYGSRSLSDIIRGNIEYINPYPTAFPYGNGMVLHFYQQQESSTTKTVHKVINKGLKAYV